MEIGKWTRIKDAVAAALEMEESERSEFFLSVVDLEIRDEAERLVWAHFESGKFIEKPAAVAEGHIEDEDNDPLVGETVGGYRIVNRIGAGGMGAVYLTEKPNSDVKQSFALKLIKRGMDSEAILKRFARERRILGTLKHANIAGMIDGGISDDGRPYFVMEYVEGVPLNTYCREANPGLVEILQIFTQLCSAVDYAHRNLVIHRDLKPSNIIVAADGTAKLLDFGIAKLISDDSEGVESTIESSALTPEYASPEQILGRPVSTGTDIYSLGVILFEMLTCKRPYDMTRGSFSEIVRSITETEPPPPSSVVDRGSGRAESETDENFAPRTLADRPRFDRKMLAGDLDNIVLKALRKDPLERYASVGLFSEDISRYLIGLPVSARPLTARYRFGKFVRRHRAGVAAAGLVVVSLLAGTSVATWQAVVARRERTRAEKRFNDVRKFANTVLFDYYERIKEMPGATEVREKMVKDSLEYLNNLAEESDYSVDLQRELALAYRKVGDIQGGDASGGQLGESGGALASYQKALAIQEKVVAANPANIEDRRLLARLMIDISQKYQNTGDLNESENHAEKAIEIFRQLADEQPNELKSRSDLARALWTLAAVVRARGDIEGALKSYGQAAEIYEQLAVESPENRNYSRNAALTFKNIGGTLEQQRDFAAALELYEKALAVDLKNTTEEPNNVQWKMDLSFSYGSLSSVLQHLGRKEAAFEGLNKKLAIQETVVSADPKNAFAQRALAITFREMGDWFQKLAQMPEAIGNYQKSIEIHRQLSGADLNNVEVRRSLGESLTQLAAVLGKSNSREVAEKAFQEAGSVLRELPAKVPNDNLTNKSLAVFRAEYGFFQQKNAKNESALENFREALKLLETQSTQNDWTELKASIYEGIGDVQLLLDQKTEAADSYQKSLEIRQNSQRAGKLSTENSNRISQIQMKIIKIQK